MSFLLTGSSHHLDRSFQMGRRFPEFCIIRAACRVSVKASSSATGDGRVASYQAAIDAVAVQHYVHWPFMVEVLNKWLEMNRDFVRDPIGYVAPGSPPGPPTAVVDDHPFTVSTTQDTPNQTITSAAVISGHRLAYGMPTASLPETSGSATSSSPAPSTTRTDVVGVSHSSLNGQRGAPVPIWRISPLSWIGPFVLFLRRLRVAPSSPFSNWRATPMPLVHQTPSLAETRWLRPFFPDGLYRRWWGVLEKSFTFRSG